MQDVTITFTRGTSTGNPLKFELGEVFIGTQPGPRGLLLKNANHKEVSRLHARLQDSEGVVELYNLSISGTRVDGKLVQGSIKLNPGAKIAIGANHVFLIEWESFVRVNKAETADGQERRTAAPAGPLASPIVRSVIAVYLLSMVGLMYWLSSTNTGTGVAADDWPQLRNGYEAFQPGTISPELRNQRLARAELLVRELRALKTQKNAEDIEPVCRQIMAVDSDIHSPLFQYGAGCLAAVKSEEF